MGFPGSFVAKNITPFNLKGWSDGEIYRAITSGVDKDGRTAFFPVMPYLYYSKLATEDVYSIIAYVRSLPSIESHPGITKADFPMNIILHTIRNRRTRAAANFHGPGVQRRTSPMPQAAANATPSRKRARWWASPSPRRIRVPLPERRHLTLLQYHTGFGERHRRMGQGDLIRKFKQFADSSYVPAPIDWKAGISKQ